MAQDPKTDEYYPIRWKIADAVEDIFVLHRSKAIGVIALIGLAFILFGFLLLGWGGATSQTNTANPASSSSTDTIGDTDDAEDESATTVSSAAPSTTAAPTTAAPTTAPATTAPTTTLAVSSRGVATPEQLAATESGPVIELSPSVIRLAGGLTTDAEADAVVELVESIFTEIEVDDQQVVDDGFESVETWNFRLSAPDLFGYNSDALNATYLPLVDQLAAAAIDAGTWRIEVSGHTDDSGPAPGNQRLSERRAASAAQRLISEGVNAGQVTSIGRGEEDPVATNDTEAGRLANRRVEFLVTP